MMAKQENVKKIHVHKFDKKKRKLIGSVDWKMCVEHCCLYVHNIKRVRVA